MNVFSAVYVLYFLFTISVIHLMARSLSRTSRTFLLEAFHGNSDRTSLVNRVIIASFFLANVGFVVSEAPYRYLDHPTTREALTTLLERLGSAMLFLGFTLFLGLWIFARMRRLGAVAPTTR